MNEIELLAAVPTLAAAVGLILGIRVALEYDRSKPAKPRPDPGWVYFAAPVGALEDDRPGLIKIGMTHRDPRKYRLPELGQISPVELEIIHTIPSHDPVLLEATLHQELKDFRHHGEWYEREPVLAYLDHVRATA